MRGIDGLPIPSGSEAAVRIEPDAKPCAVGVSQYTLLMERGRILNPDSVEYAPNRGHCLSIAVESVSCRDDREKEQAGKHPVVHCVGICVSVWACRQFELE